MNKTGVAITSLIGGMLIGAAVSMLMTPQSGPELRKKIKDFVDDEMDKVRGKVDKVRGKVEEMREEMLERVEEARCKCAEK